MRLIFFFQFILLLSLSSCGTRLEYKKVTFKTSSNPSRNMKLIIYESNHRNFDNGTVFIHHKDSIIQLYDVSYFNDTISRELNGKIVILDSMKFKLYQYMNKYPEGNYAFKKETVNDFRQMHFYTSGIQVDKKKNSISVNESEIDKIEKYYPKPDSRLKPLFITLGTAGIIGIFTWLLIGLS